MSGATTTGTRGATAKPFDRLPQRRATPLPRTGEGPGVRADLRHRIVVYGNKTVVFD